MSRTITSALERRVCKGPPVGDGAGVEAAEGEAEGAEWEEKDNERGDATRRIAKTR